VISPGTQREKEIFIRLSFPEENARKEKHDSIFRIYFKVITWIMGPNIP